MEKLRIAVLSWESLYTIQIGGLGVVATRLAEELAKEGHEVYFFTQGGEGQPQYMRINGVNYYICKFDPGPNILSFAYNMSRSIVKGLHEVEKLGNRFDIVHGHDWLVVDALHNLKEEGYPFVLTFHSTEFGRNGGSFGDRWEFRAISEKEWHGGFIADKITTVSSTMQKELTWLYHIPSDKIDVIPNAIDPEKKKLKIDPGRVKERYGIHPLAPVVQFVGRLEHQKGPDLLVEAIPKVLNNRSDVKFIFAGGGSMREYLEHRARELRIEHATRFLGFVPYWHFLELLNASDMICLPSRNEPFGIALLEAWAVGKPIVATGAGGLGENIENLADGIKVDTSSESLARGINYLLNSPDTMRKIAEQGSRSVERFSWKSVILKLEETYQKGLGK